MRQSTFPRLGIVLLAFTVSASVSTVAAGQSATDPVRIAAPVADVRASEAATNGAEAPRSAAGNGASETRSVLLDRRAAGLTRGAHVDTRDETPAPAPRQESGRTRTNTALMIVGAAAVVLGAAVGDEAGTVLIIGGAGIGLFGLYRLLN